jgi:hypothetical protein
MRRDRFEISRRVGKGVFKGRRKAVEVVGGRKGKGRECGPITGSRPISKSHTLGLLD